MTKVATARRSARSACAATRACASSRLQPRCVTIRAICVSTGTSTTSTASNRSACPDSTSSGMSWTTSAPAGAADSISAARARISGCRIPSRRRRACSSPKTTAPSRARSSRPSSVSTSSPNSATTAASPGVPGSTTSRATASASMTTAPSSRRRRDTSLLPDPMPPVRPTVSTRLLGRGLLRSRLRGGRLGSRCLGSRCLGSRCLGAGGLGGLGCVRLVGARRGDLGRLIGLVAAGQLAPQLGERLVAGQRACGRLGRRLGGVGRRFRCLDLGGLGLLDLLLVGLPASLGGGVLRLPLGLLRLVARLPLAGLGVEALRVDVVARLVVLRGHAVLRRVEVVGDRLADRALVGLLQGQRDAPALEVDVDDLDVDLVADVDDLLRDLYVTLGELGDVDEALDALGDPDERAERHQLGDAAGNNLTDRVGAGERLPRVFLGRLERQRDPLAVHVDVEDLDGDLLADLDDLARVVDVLPGQLGDVDQAVDATEVDEGAEVDDRGDDALADLPLLELGEEVLSHLALGLLEPGAAGEHDVVAVLVELDDLRLELLADERLEIADAAHLDQRCREEAAQTDVEDEATLDDLDDGARDDAVLVLDLLDRAPGALVLRALLGQDQPALLVLLLENKCLDLVAHGDDVVGVDVVLDRELTARDDALGLVTDVEQDLVAVDPDDDPLHDVAVVELLDRAFDRGHEVIGGADVVDGDLGRALAGGGIDNSSGGGRHVVGDSSRGGLGDRRTGRLDSPVGTTRPRAEIALSGV